VLVILAAGAAGAVRFVVYGHVVPALAGMPLSTARAYATAARLRLELRPSTYSSTIAAGDVITESLRPGSHVRSGTVVVVVVSRGRAPVPVPGLTGKSRAAAVDALVAGHLVPDVTEAYSETVAAGEVISSAPSSGTAAYGGRVSVVVSNGPAPRTIPGGLVGIPWQSVRATVAGLRLYPVEQLSYSTTVPSGDVIATDPASGVSGVEVGTTVDVVVSKGPRLVSVPSVAGQSISAALAALELAGLDVTEQIGPPDATYATTTVPSPGTEVEPGTQITLYAG
jgi:serine/threonine-protein kinase